MTFDKNSAPSLKERLQQPGLLVAPGVYDMVSLRLADSFDFGALYMTGYGTVASHLGLPDAGIATYSDMVGRVTAMAGMARTPLIADADTGYGGLLNLRHTVRGRLHCKLKTKSSPRNAATRRGDASSPWTTWCKKFAWRWSPARPLTF
jgi:2-methylisocitrate lyase-like PEP mutase family enzyme